MGMLAVFCLIVSILTVTRCQSLMKSYRFACQQDMNAIFAYMNQRYAGSVNFAAARSTHRSNGTVNLGITVTLQQMIAIQGNNNMNQTDGNATTSPQQPLQGVPVRLANGQIAYAIQQSDGQQLMAMPKQQQGQPQVIQVVVPQQGQTQNGAPPVYQPPAMSEYQEGDGLVNNQ